MAEFSQTGSIEANPVRRTRFQRKGLPITLIDGTPAGGSLKDNQEVKLSANGTVVARTLGTEFPIGTVTVPKNPRKPNDNHITVAVNFDRDIYGSAGALLTVGTEVRQDGTFDADDRPVYVAAVAGDYVSGITLSGAASGAELRVGVLLGPYKKA